MNIYDSDEDGGKKKKNKKDEDSDESDDDSEDGDRPARKRGRPRTVSKSMVKGFTDAEVRRFIKSYKKFPRPFDRWDLIPHILIFYNWWAIVEKRTEKYRSVNNSFWRSPSINGRLMQCFIFDQQYGNVSSSNWQIDLEK